MAQGRFSTLIRLGKPVLAGLALAYLVTAFVDRPEPVHFQPENPFRAQQTAIVEPQVSLVVEKNIMKLGSPLSVAPAKAVPEENPLAALERASGEDNGTVPAAPLRREPGVYPAASSAPPQAVRGEVDSVPVPLPEPGQ